jgi:flavin reductase (DIM6/NTAB) family NADH-FMN oxidoreductase RutF
MDTRIARALRLLSSHAYVMSSQSEGRTGAATVTWLSLASLDPPLLMASVRRDGDLFRYMAAGGLVVVHTAAKDQQDMAQRFLLRGKRGDAQYERARPVSGKASEGAEASLPVRIECEVGQIIHTEGDYAVVILRVVHVECEGDPRRINIGGSSCIYTG